MELQSLDRDMREGRVSPEVAMATSRDVKCASNCSRTSDRRRRRARPASVATRTRVVDVIVTKGARGFIGGLACSRHSASTKNARSIP